MLLDPMPCWVEASMRVNNSTPLGRPLLLTVTTINCVETLKVPPRDDQQPQVGQGPDA
jgi:hypothetical protein